jgi:hypothetical protein
VSCDSKEDLKKKSLKRETVMTMEKREEQEPVFYLEYPAVCILNM